MRTLAIDPGTRRVGLALSDAGGKLATPFDVLNITHPSQAIDRILRIVEEEGVERLVVGLPLNMDGSRGKSADDAMELGSALASCSGKPVIYVDERLSSFQAEQDLIDRQRGGEKLTRKSKKKRLDAIAAATFLQAFLDGRLMGMDTEDSTR